MLNTKAATFCCNLKTCPLFFLIHADHRSEINQLIPIKYTCYDKYVEKITFFCYNNVQDVKMCFLQMQSGFKQY